MPHTASHTRIAAIQSIFPGRQPVAYANRIVSVGKTPGKVIRIHKVVMMGSPDDNRVCTSHVERSNLSIRTSVRRLTRLTLAHSKKWRNHQAALALWFAYYNYCRVHTTLKTTPAVAAGLADRTWSVADLLSEIAA